MSRDELTQIVLAAKNLPLTVKAFALTAINLATQEQIESVSEIFGQAEAVYHSEGIEGLKKFLADRGVPPQGIAILEQVAPYAAKQTAESSHPIE